MSPKYLWLRRNNLTAYETGLCLVFFSLTNLIRWNSSFIYRSPCFSSLLSPLSRLVRLQAKKSNGKGVSNKYFIKESRAVVKGGSLHTEQVLQSEKKRKLLPTLSLFSDTADPGRWHEVNLSAPTHPSLSIQEETQRPRNKLHFNWGEEFTAKEREESRI